MRRREFVVAVAGLYSWPQCGRAQTVPIIGFLSSASAAEHRDFVAAFRRVLGELGLVEGQNITVEYRWAEGDYDRLPEMAVDLLSHEVSVIAAVGGAMAPIAAKAATSVVPIVFAQGADPVKTGLVRSLSRPEGNVTGATLFTGELGAKRLELLRALVPAATTFAVLVNPKNPNSRSQVEDAEAASQAAGQKLRVVRVSDAAGLEPSYAELVARQVGGLMVAADPLFSSRRAHMVALAARHAIPTIYTLREYVQDGGLISYGTSIGEAYRLAGLYTGRILRGAKLSDLPVLLPSKFELALNAKTAAALRLSIPPALLVSADEVIE